MLDGIPIVSGAPLLDVLGGLLPHWFCVPCLARLSERPEPPIRNELHALWGRLEFRAGECRNCTATGLTYRIRKRAV